MIIGFLGGTVLGVLFFGGLYYSVGRLTQAKYPALMMMISTVIRMAILLAGVYLLVDGDFRKILAALVGIVLAKFAILFIVEKKWPVRKGKE